MQRREEEIDMSSWVDERTAHAPAEICFQVVRDVERWPYFMPHFRSVRFLREMEPPGCGEVEMAAWSIIGGPLRLPASWILEVRVDQERFTIDHRHLGGVARGMTIRWQILDDDVDTRLRISSYWDRSLSRIPGQGFTNWIIGAQLVRAVARSTLRGIAVEAQRLTHAGERG